MIFIKDKRFYIPALFILCFELILQTGIYSHILKKNSYASTAFQVTEHAINLKHILDPEILIVSTSVGYQGLSVSILNSKVKPFGYKIQSISIPGSELIVQHLALSKVLKDLKNVKYIIHVVEITMPWVQQENISLHTLAMIGEFNKFEAIKKIYDYQYNVKYDDIAYIGIKSISYRRDLRDFLLAPNERIKYLGRKWKIETKPSYYENEHPEQMSDYPTITTIDNCLEKSNITNNEPIPATSNIDHKKAIFDTCAIAKHTNEQLTNSDTRFTALYFNRLKEMYSDLHKKNIKIINVMAPYSELIKGMGGIDRMNVWKNEVNKINGDSNTIILDMQDILNDGNNGDYFYDLIHLNKKGMIQFSNHLGYTISSILPPKGNNQ